MLLILSAVLALFGIIFPAGNVANAAHLGGMLAGVVFIRQFIQHRWWQWELPARRAAPRELVNIGVAKWQTGSRPNRESDDLPAEEFLSREVDPILDKISAHGIQSLTERERQILEAARKKMERH